MAWRRDDHVVRVHLWRPTSWETEHDRDAGAKDIGLDQPDARPELLQCERQVDAHRGFPDADFAAADGDDTTYPTQLFGTDGRL